MRDAGDFGVSLFSHPNFLRPLYTPLPRFSPRTAIPIIATALLCANHVTYRFGKGMMPPAYRLSAEAARAILEGYEKQLAEEYGPEAAAQMIAGGDAGGGGSGNGVYRRTPFEHHSSPGASPAASASDLNHSSAHLVRDQQDQQYQQEHQRQQAQQREREVTREEREAQRREEYARLEREQEGQHGYQDMQRQHGGGHHDEGEDGGDGGYGDDGYDLSAYGRESAYGGAGGAYGGTGEHAQHDKYNF
ncbi:hypothetical protein C8R47DRAFT_1226781 [Mycena vitilis]|nr:hypothetical protein C8R47DRAFT_1226781 [Mycena vitilis]